MTRIVYVNGKYCPYAEAQLPVEDRSSLFADGVYEVCPVRRGRIMDMDLHFERLHRSLDGLDIRAPMSDNAFAVILKEVVRRNRVKEGLIYFQVSRGVARRNHAFPDPAVPPSVVAMARSTPPSSETAGIKVITQPDIRWQRVDIKSLSLLPNVLAREAAKQQGAREAWMFDADGYITEGSASNAWIIDETGKLRTRRADQAILRGITRTIIADIIADHGVELEERAFNVAEAKAAREAFITSASAKVTPVVQIDDTQIGNGAPGELSLRIGDALEEFVIRQT